MHESITVSNDLEDCIRKALGVAMYLSEGSDEHAAPAADTIVDNLTRAKEIMRERATAEATTAEGPGTTDPVMALDDCAGLFQNNAEWQSALLSAIGRILYRADPLSMEGIDPGDRIEVEPLTAIGKHLADSAWSKAKEYVDTAAGLRGAA